MSDTIAAIATAPGQGGIAIVRVSGDMAEDFTPHLPPSRRETSAADASANLRVYCGG